MSVTEATVTDEREFHRDSHLSVTPLPCDWCGGDILAGAPVVRYEYIIFRDDGAYSLDHLCKPCAADLTLSKEPRPCEQCKRPVYFADRYRSRALCSKRCEIKFYRTNPIQQLNWYGRKSPTLIPCQTCGEAFHPKRKDARTCSAACRQKAYRQRQGGAA
jgi:hypothetical protein